MANPDPPHNIVVQCHPHWYQQQQEVGLVCWKIGQVLAVDVHRDLRTQYHILVQLDDGHHHICYPDELVSYALS